MQTLDREYLYRTLSMIPHLEYMDELLVWERPVVTVGPGTWDDIKSLAILRDRLAPRSVDRN